MDNREVGNFGEDIAVAFLKNKGFAIIKKNFRCRLGEIDIVAVKDNLIVFCEVKTRFGLKQGKPHEAVTPLKLRHLKLASQYYLLKNNYKGYKMRIDVIAIVLNEDISVKKLNHFENVSF